MSVSVRGDVKDIIRHIDKTQRWVVPQAVPAAINKTTAKINTQVRREISKRLGIPQKAFKGKIKVYKASRRRWRGKNWIGLKTQIPVTKVFKSERKQISYAKSKQLIGANRVFGATMPTGNQGIFYRKTKKRLPIQEVTIDLSAVAEPTLHALGQVITNTEFKRLLRHELQWRLNRKA